MIRIRKSTVWTVLSVIAAVALGLTAVVGFGAIKAVAAPSSDPPGVCGPHGTGTAGNCTCDAGWTGPTCSSHIIATNGECNINESGDVCEAGSTCVVRNPVSGNGICEPDTPPEVCEDPAANNIGEPLPCTFDEPEVCEDPAANNVGEPLPCTFDEPEVCEDPAANNVGGSLPCTYDQPPEVNPCAPGNGAATNPACKPKNGPEFSCQEHHDRWKTLNNVETEVRWQGNHPGHVFCKAWDAPSDTARLKKADRE